MTITLNRRRLLRELAAAAVVTSSRSLRGQTQRKLAAWAPGALDIHHISTGRGSCAFLICPDGTTMLIDAGSSGARPEVRKYLIDPKPDGSRRPGEWIARYITRHMMAAGLTPAIDYVILTHFHSDHMGETSADAPR